MTTKSAFVNLVLFPTIFCTALIGSFTFRVNPWAICFSVMLLAEHLVDWQKSLSTRQISDYRSFFVDEIVRYYYVLGVFSACIFATFLAPLIGFFVAFPFALNWIVFRGIASQGVVVIEKTPSAPSNFVSSDFEAWSDNKNLLSKYLHDAPDSELKSKILSRLEYSSFLRTSEAAALISKNLLLKIYSRM